MPTVEGRPSTKRIYPLHDNMYGGVQTTKPAHLLGPDEWRTQHNWRLTPELTQVPRKKIYQTVGSEDILWMGAIPLSSGYSKVLLWTPTAVKDLIGTTFASSLTSDSTFRRWSTAIYDQVIYYVNELNAVRKNTGTTDVAISGAPSGRYLCFWYDHMVVGYPTFGGITYPSRVMMSTLGYFSDVTVTLPSGSTVLKAWTPTGKGSEATHYDFLEWQQTDFPYAGCTGLGKLKGMLWVYTPTAIIPTTYVGLPKVIQVQEQGILTRVGNTFPWTLVCLDQLHFFYDAVEQMFWAFDGAQLIPIGEPVRGYMRDNLNTTPALAAKMYGYVDIDYREIWWPFVSTASSGAFDKAVVFNYRYKKWYTASVEDIKCFVGGSNAILTVGELTGLVSALTGTAGNLGLGAGSAPRLFGSASGVIYREEVAADLVETLFAQDTPTLESGDFHYGDIRTTKENDLMVLNAAWDAAQNPTGKIEVSVASRDLLGSAPTYVLKADWTQILQDAISTYKNQSGRVFRYKFQAKNTRSAVFSAWSESVYAKLAEK